MARRFGGRPRAGKGSCRVARLEAGNFGDCKPLREGVSELRIDWGPGYRPSITQWRGEPWYCCSAVAINGDASRRISSGPWAIGRITRRRRARHETKSQHFARQGDRPRLRDDPEFASEYLKAALEESDEPQVLLSPCGTSRRQEVGSPRSPRQRASNGKVCIGRCSSHGEPTVVNARGGYQGNWP